MRLKCIDTVQTFVIKVQLQFGTRNGGFAMESRNTIALLQPTTHCSIFTNQSHTILFLPTNHLPLAPAL